MALHRASFLRVTNNDDDDDGIHAWQRVALEIAADGDFGSRTQKSEPTHISCDNEFAGGRFMVIMAMPNFSSMVLITRSLWAAVEKRNS